MAARTFRTFKACILLVLFVGVTEWAGLSAEANEIKDADKPIPVLHIEGVLGSKGVLPCDIGLADKYDKLHMVLWFRERDGEPIYRYDVRDRLPAEAKRWSAAEYRERLYFQTIMEPKAKLFISDLAIEDEGLYRCRVDFKNSPTRNIKVNLTVIVPPEKPVIYDSTGMEVRDVIGPIPEGSDLVLTCEVAGGRPPPRLTWWLDNVIVDRDDQMRIDGVMTNKLVFPALRREHLNAKFTCQAVNTKHAPPLVADARVGLYLRPLSTTITTKDAHLTADKRYEIECVSIGSRPAPEITWWKFSRPMEFAAADAPKAEHSDDLNTTRSTIYIKPRIEDDGTHITCRSVNAYIPSSVQEDRYRLNVFYPPKVSLQLGSNLNADDIKEGDDVYFECAVKANPQYTRLMWFHEGKEIRQNHHNQKIFMSTTRLVIQEIKRHNAGNYTCNAVNSMGQSQSNVVNLRIKFVPTCKSSHQELIGAARLETVMVRCQMDADPPEVRFAWTFNSSVSEVRSVKAAQFTSTGTVSLLNHTVYTEAEYGTLACWGVNDIGKGAHGPCYFQIVSAGKPHAPKNCSILNETQDAIMISCIEGFDGGLPQQFLVEVININAKKIVLNSASRTPTFTLENLEPGVDFRVFVYAFNSKGRSEPFVLDGISRQVPKPIVGGFFPELPPQQGVNPVFAVFVACAAVLSLILLVSVIAIWRKSRSRKPKPSPHEYREDEDEDETFEPMAPAITKLDQNGTAAGEEIGNPDVVPAKNGRSGGIRGFIRIHKTPPARRRKKDVEIKNNGEVIALTDPAEEAMYHLNNGVANGPHPHASSLSSLNNQRILNALPTKESRI